MNAQRQWTVECQAFTQQGYQEALNAQSPAELMIAVQRTHSALERTFRNYLSEEKRIEDANNQKDTDFPTLLELMASHVPAVFTATSIDTLHRYNSLRNRVAHEQIVPEKREVDDFAEFTREILLRFTDAASETTVTLEPIAASGVWVCPICKTENEPNRKYCKSCGREKEQARREAHGLELCPACGKFENKRGEKFCGGCGANIAERKQDQRILNPTCGCVAGTVALACLIGALIWIYQSWLRPTFAPILNQAQATSLGWFNASPPVLSVTSLAVDSTNSNIAYAGTIGQYGVFKTIDGGKTWSAANNGLGDLDIRSLAVSPANPDLVYSVGYNNGRLWISYFSGRKWDLTEMKYDSIPPTQRIYLELQGLMRIVPDRGSQATLYGIVPWGFGKTEDGGLKWLLTPTSAGDITDMAIAYNPFIVYVVGRERVSKSTDAGKSWTPVSTIAANYAACNLAIDSDNAKLLYAGTGGGIYKSIDGGSFWSPVSGNLPEQGKALRTTAILADPTRANTVYAAFERYGVYISVDAGQTWKSLFPVPIASSPPRNLPNDSPYYTPGCLVSKWGEITVLATSPAKPRYLYVGGRGIGVWRYELP